jgi:hypothetical protein
MKKQITFHVFGSFDKIYNSFADLEIFGDLHPLIVKVNKSLQLDENIAEYDIMEQPFTWLPFKIKYKSLVRTTDNKVEYNVFDLPFTKGTIVYNFTEIESKNCTEIIFNLHLESKLLGRKILLNKMLKAQIKLIDKLNKK